MSRPGAIDALGRWTEHPLGFLALVLGPAVALSVVVAATSAESSAGAPPDRRAAIASLRREVEKAWSADGPLREVRDRVAAGDTLESMLLRLGLGPDEVTRWSATSKQYASLVRLEPDGELSFLLPSGTDRLAGLGVAIAPGATLLLRRDGDEFHSWLDRGPETAELRVAEGTIESSLYAAAKGAGVPDAVISTMVDVFGWDVDFSADLQPGDTFRVSYDLGDPASGARARPRVRVAELSAAGKRWQAVYYEPPGHAGRYYSPEGRAYGRAFLRYPVEYARITSPFAAARMHPILGVRRPHLGIDFASPIGTPIRAIGAGTVTRAGWDGGFGRSVRIEHASGLSSQYAHMSAIAEGIRVGARVEMGDVIGAVGATGLATGPHCHFALWRNGAYVNPLTARIPEAAPLDGASLREFAAYRDGALAALDRGTRHVAREASPARGG